MPGCRSRTADDMFSHVGFITILRLAPNAEMVTARWTELTFLMAQPRSTHLDGSGLSHRRIHPQSDTTGALPDRTMRAATRCSACTSTEAVSTQQSFSNNQADDSIDCRSRRSDLQAEELMANR